MTPQHKRNPELVDVRSQGLLILSHFCTFSFHCVVIIKLKNYRRKKGITQNSSGESFWVIKISREIRFTLIFYGQVLKKKKIPPRNHKTINLAT